MDENDQPTQPDENEGGAVFDLDAVRAIGLQDAAEATTEAEDRDATQWAFHVQSCETAAAHNLAMAAKMENQAQVLDALADGVRVLTTLAILFGVKRLFRGRA